MAGQDLKWIKSSRSGGNGGGSCVEVAVVGNGRAVRDSKDPHGPMLVFERGSWNTFLRAVKQSMLDLT